MLLLAVFLVLLLTIGAVGEVAAAPYDTGLDAFCENAPDSVHGDYCG